MTITKWFIWARKNYFQTSLFRHHHVSWIWKKKKASSIGNGYCELGFLVGHVYALRSWYVSKLSKLSIMHISEHHVCTWAMAPATKLRRNRRIVRYLSGTLLKLKNLRPAVIFQSHLRFWNIKNKWIQINSGHSNLYQIQKIIYFHFQLSICSKSLFARVTSSEAAHLPMLFEFWRHISPGESGNLRIFWKNKVDTGRNVCH